MVLRTAVEKSISFCYWRRFYLIPPFLTISFSGYIIKDNVLKYLHLTVSSVASELNRALNMLPSNVIFRLNLDRNEFILGRAFFALLDRLIECGIILKQIFMHFLKFCNLLDQENVHTTDCNIRSILTIMALQVFSNCRKWEMPVILRMGHVNLLLHPQCYYMITLWNCLTWQVNAIY